jgi:CRP-like cAMP-binding protein
LPAAQRQKLADCAMSSSFTAGETIFRENDPANRFYLIRTGSVALETEQAEGEAIRIVTLGPGDLLGWSWLFAPYRWQFSARALDPVSAVFFYGTRLREHCEADPELGMAEVMMQRLQAARRQLTELSAIALRSQAEALQLTAQLGCAPPGRKHFRPAHAHPHNPPQPKYKS